MSGRQEASTDITVFDAITTSLVRAARFNPEDQVAPTVVLWTDSDRQWESLIPRLQERLPQLLVLGGYEPEARRGPAIWLRCVIARRLPETAIPDDAVPLLDANCWNDCHYSKVPECSAGAIADEEKG